MNIRLQSITPHNFEISGRCANAANPFRSSFGQIECAHKMLSTKSIARALGTLAFFFCGLTAHAQSNDLFSNRVRLSGDNVVAAPVNTRNAGRETGEPGHYGASNETLWWEWTAPRTGTYTIDSAGSAIDTAMAVYEGTTLNRLNRVVASDNPPGSIYARVTLTTTAGTTYQIMVAPGNNSNGSVTFRISFAGPSSAPTATGTDAFNDRPRLTGVAFLGQAQCATSFEARETGEPGHPYSYSGNSSHWWEWTAPATGNATINLNGEDMLGRSFDTVLTVYAGKELNRLSRVRNNDNAIGAVGSRVEFPTAAGETYQIVAVSKNGAVGTFRLALAFSEIPSQAPARVGTDDFNARPTLEASGALGVGQTHGATRQPSEPSHPETREQTLWWQWIAPSNGNLILDTAGSILSNGSPFDTNLIVYAGNVINSLSRIGYNLDAPGRVTSRLVVPVTAGVSYQIVVGPDDQSNGNVSLSLEFVPAAPGRLSNLAVRSNAGAGENTLIVGFTLSGAGQRSLLARGVGPSLASFGLSGVLSDPSMNLLSGSTSISSNDNWGGGSTLAQAFATAGAFALPTSSLDSAILRSLGGGGYTTQIAGRPGTSGVTLAEIYDLGGNSDVRLTNLSARSRVGSGGDVLIIGFTITEGPAKLLIRGSGPALAAFGVPGTLADPQLKIYSGGNLVAENGNWAPELAQQFAAVGAFAFPSNSNDSAISLTLPPGGYTAQLSGVNNTTGVALVEVYVAP